MPTFSTVERLLEPLGPVYDLIGEHEPALATNNGTVLPARIEHISKMGTVVCKLDADSDGRFIGGTLKHFGPDVMVEPGDETITAQPVWQKCLERTWTGGQDFEGFSYSNGVYTRHSVQFLHEDCFTAVIGDDSHSQEYEVLRLAEEDSDAATWVIDHANQHIAIYRDAADRLGTEFVEKRDKAGILRHIYTTTCAYDTNGGLTSMKEYVPGETPHTTTFDRSDPQRVQVAVSLGAPSLVEEQVVVQREARHYDAWELLRLIERETCMPGGWTAKDTFHVHYALIGAESETSEEAAGRTVD